MMPSVRRSGMQQQVGILAVVRGERGRPGGLDGAVVHHPLDLGFDAVIVDHGPEPGEGVRLESFAPTLPQGASIVGCTCCPSSQRTCSA